MRGERLRRLFESKASSDRLLKPGVTILAVVLDENILTGSHA
jgi:hypothetical protein